MSAGSLVQPGFSSSQLWSGRFKKGPTFLTEKIGLLSSSSGSVCVCVGGLVKKGRRGGRRDEMGWGEEKAIRKSL